MKNKYDFIIVGGGPSGLSAAIYAGRSNIDFALFSINFGGQLNRTKIIENYSGYESIAGYSLALKLLKHAKQFCDKDRIINQKIIKINLYKKNNLNFELITENNKKIYCKFLLLSFGSQYKKLNIDNEDKYFGNGIGNCVICEGFFYKNKIIAIIGGGNSALTGALYMTNIANKIYLINKNNKFKGEDILIKKINNNDKIKIFYNNMTIKFDGNNKNLQKVIIKNKINKKITNLIIDAAFIKIGLKPNISILNFNLELNKNKEIIVDYINFSTKIKNLYACGDIINFRYKQAIISAAQGTIVSLDVKNKLS